MSFSTETLFRSLPHIHAALEAWRADYNTNRPHSTALVGQASQLCCGPSVTAPLADRLHLCPKGHLER